MTRLQILLTALIGVLLVVGFWFLVYSPAQEELDRIEAEIEDEQAQQATLQSQINRLREIRLGAPEAESRLAFARSIVPDDPSLPALLRQLQSGADDAGVTVVSMTASRPALIDEEVGLADVGITIQVTGTYFQSVDFLRRLEDPTITPRGVLWESLNVARGDEYPDLALTLSGSTFTMSTAADIPEDVEEPVVEVDPDGEVEGGEVPVELEEDEE